MPEWAARQLLHQEGGRGRGRAAAATTTRAAAHALCSISSPRLRWGGRARSARPGLQAEPPRYLSPSHSPHMRNAPSPPGGRGNCGG